MSDHLSSVVAPALLEVADLWREFPSGEGSVAVLKGINLRIQSGEMVAIMGASGSGKSTLMNISAAWIGRRAVSTRSMGKRRDNWGPMSWPACAESTSDSSFSAITCWVI